MDHRLHSRRWIFCLLGEIGKLSEFKLRCREACGFESHSKYIIYCPGHMSL